MFVNYCRDIQKKSSGKRLSSSIPSLSNSTLKRPLSFRVPPTVDRDAALIAASNLQAVDVRDEFLHLSLSVASIAHVSQIYLPTSILKNASHIAPQYDSQWQLCGHGRAHAPRRAIEAYRRDNERRRTRAPISPPLASSKVIFKRSTLRILYTESGVSSQGSFSVVSKPILAIKYSWRYSFSTETWRKPCSS